LVKILPSLTHCGPTNCNSFDFSTKKQMLNKENISTTFLPSHVHSKVTYLILWLGWFKK
jgi:hypothetical protein